MCLVLVEVVAIPHESGNIDSVAMMTERHGLQ